MRWEAEDGPCRFHREDEVEVGGHHGYTRQEGEAEAKTANAAAESCGHPINQPADTQEPMETSRRASFHGYIRQLPLERCSHLMLPTDTDCVLRPDGRYVSTTAGCRRFRCQAALCFL